MGGRVPISMCNSDLEQAELRAYMENYANNFRGKL